MTFRNIRLGRTALIAMSAAVLLVAGLRGNAVAGVDCGSKTSPHAASIQCRGASLRSQAHAPVGAKGAALSDGGELTPLSDAQVLATRAHKAEGFPRALNVSAFSLRSSFGLDALRKAANRQVTSPKASTIELPTDRHRSATTAADARSSLGQVFHGGGSAIPALPAPFAWTILLAGLLGICGLSRAPRVARVQSWVMATPSRSTARVWNESRAIDRIDAARYAEVWAMRSHQGHFVRSANKNARFGARF